MGVAGLLVLAGFVWLVYKAPYLGMDAPDDLKAFIIAPSAVLLVAASFVGFSDPRRRAGFGFMALGLVALAWLALAPLPNGGWTFYTPYASTTSDRPVWIKGPDAFLAAGTTLLPFLGVAVLARRSIFGGLLVGAAFWCALCLSSARAFDAWSGMPHRYSYYYVGNANAQRHDFEAVVPIFLGLMGVALLVRTRRGPSDVGPTVP